MTRRRKNSENKQVQEPEQKEESQFYADLAFDEDELDKAWQGQPLFFMQYAEQASEARKKEEEAKEALAVKEAELAKNMRTNPDDYGLEKTTESAIKEAVTSHNDRKVLAQAVTDARYERELLQYAVTAFEHRKKALENAVSLHLCGFYSQPKMKNPEEQIRANLNEQKENE